MAIKRVRVEELRPGMFIHDLNCGWLDHPFIRPRFKVSRTAQIERIRAQGIRELYIDTARGTDVLEAPTQSAIQRDLHAQLLEAAESPAPADPAPVPREQEVPVARRILGEAGEVVGGLLRDVRLGKQLEPARARPLVRAMRASVMRNPGALVSLGRIKEADTYTFQHSVSTCTLLIAFCHAMGMDGEAVEEAGLGALLHDVGKMKVPNRILNKPGSLTETEAATMKSHAAIGAEILASVPGLPPQVVRIAAEHHERVGGGGYPRGLAGEAISLGGRMTAIVDVYDAMTSNRVYHRRSEPTEVLKRLLEWGGTQLDLDLVQQFIRALGIYPVGSLVRLESGRLAVVLDQGADLLKPRVRLVRDTRSATLLPPQDLDLSEAGAEAILDYEAPEDWDMDPAAYL